MSRRLKLDRRKFLLSAGATALTLPFLRALPSYAQSGEDKRYLILAFSANGVIRHKWGANVTGPGPADWTFKEYLAPLAAVKDKVIVLDGIQHKAAGGGSHEAGFAGLWTGVDTSSGSLASGESIDQAIARELNAGTVYPSLEFMVRSPEDYESKSVQTRMIYSGPQAPVDPRDDPEAARDVLFGGLATMPGDTPDPAVLRKQAMRQKIFAHVDAELGAMGPRLCNEDRAHLDALRDGFNSLNRRFTMGPGEVTAECANPITDPGALGGYPLDSRKMADVLAMALACDFTRVASLQWSHALSNTVHHHLKYNDVSLSEGHHDLSHQQPFPFAFATPNEPTPAEEAAHAGIFGKLTSIGVWYAGEVAYLAQKLASFPVGGGKTLLDQTVICWGSEIDHGANHDHVNHPFVLIGGGAGMLKTDQYVQYPKEARGHNDLLVTLARVMGVNLSSFGASQFNTGPLTELLI